MMGEITSGIKNNPVTLFPLELLLALLRFLQSDMRRKQAANYTAYIYVSEFYIIVTHIPASNV